MGILVVFLGALALGYLAGSEQRARKIAEAIRSGNLSLHQRIDAVARQIESGRYVDITGGRR